MSKQTSKEIIKNYELSEHLRFEKLLGQLSTMLVNLPFDRIESRVEKSLRLITEFFDVERCQIGRFEKPNKQIVVTHFYAKPVVTVPPISSIGDQYFSYIYNKVVSDELLVMNTPDDIPRDAEADKNAVMAMGIKSLLVLPLRLENELRYALSLSVFTRYLEWSDHVVEHAKIVGNIIANVLSRQILLEKSEGEKKWTDSILEGMPQIAYVFDAEGKLKMWNKNVERILGYSSEELKDKFVLDFIAEEDREKTFATISKVFETGQELTVEYMLQSKSGEKLPYRGSGSLSEIHGKKYLIGMTIDQTEVKEAHDIVKNQLNEIKELKSVIEAENVYLKEEIKNSHSFDEIIGKHETLLHTLYRVEQVAPIDTTVLLEGETGTGKELFARAIHLKSKRKNKPLITLNCASIPSNLFESELFGHEKGAFTGAVSRQIGKFELADGGTIFLDEVGELPYDVQAKLLRVLQEGTLERVGGKNTVKVDVRVIAATNRNLEQEVEERSFRDDLYYRLNVYPISITPLRDRISDIPELTHHFVKIFNAKLGKNITKISKKTLTQLQSYNWPGNVRELENIIERAVILSAGNSLTIEPLPVSNSRKKRELLSLEQYEKEYITEILEKTYWRINGEEGAAKILDLHPETLRSRMKKLGIIKPTKL